MPDPIIEPITIMVASIGPRARSKLDALLSIFSFIFLGQAKSRHLLLFCSFGSFGKFRGSNCYAFLLQMRPQHACKFYRSRCVTVDANRLRANIDIYVIDRLNFALPQHSHHACGRFLRIVHQSVWSVFLIEGYIVPLTAFREKFAG